MRFGLSAVDKEVSICVTFTSKHVPLPLIRTSRRDGSNDGSLHK